MKSHFYHIQINIDFEKNNKFYKDLMEFLGWDIIFEKENTLGYKSKTNGDIWFCDSLKNELSDYDNFGLSHIAIRVDKQEDIDHIVEFLKSKGTKLLFDTPRHRPEFTSQKDETYYQVIFETPDKIQIEIVYIGFKA